MERLSPSADTSLDWIDALMDKLAGDSSSSSDCSSTTATGTVAAAVAPITAAMTLEEIKLASALLSEEEKKRRHRESMARLRSGRRCEIAKLDAQEKSLTRRLYRQLARRRRTPLSPGRILAYTQLVEAAERLRLEQYQLEDRIHQWEKYARLVATETTRVQAFSHQHPNLSLLDSTRPTGDWVRLVDDQLPLFFEYESPESCVFAVDRCDQVIAQTRAQLILNDTESAHCLGWQVTSCIDGPPVSGPSMLYFRLTRRLFRSRTTLQQLETATWEILQSAKLRATVFGPTVASKTVQHVSKDAFIMLRNAPERADSLFFGLTSRKRSLDGASRSIQTMILDKEPCHAQLLWHHTGETEGRTWLRHGAMSLNFSYVNDDETIEVEYVGSIECEEGSCAARRTVEVCASLVRWHQLVEPSSVTGNN